MSESSISKTKRKYLSVFCDHYWGYQYSVFYVDVTESMNLLKDMVGFNLSRYASAPDTTFHSRPGDSPYGQFCTSRELPQYR